MIDRSNEQLIRLTQVPELLKRQTGKAISLQTVYRWVRSGLMQIHLETIFVGNVQMTSVQALERFDSEVSMAKLSPRQSKKTAASQNQIRMASELARKRLAL